MKTAAVSKHILCAPYHHAPFYSVTHTTMHQFALSLSLSPDPACVREHHPPTMSSPPNWPSHRTPLPSPCLPRTCSWTGHGWVVQPTKGGMPSGMEVSLLPSQLTVVPVLLQWQGAGQLTGGGGGGVVAVHEPGLATTAVADSKVIRHRRLKFVLLATIAALSVALGVNAARRGWRSCLSVWSVLEESRISVGGVWYYWGWLPV